MAKIFDVIARISISTLFLLNGIFKINNYEGTVGWMESFGLPGILIIPAIILEIVGPILIIIGYQTRIAAACLSLFCIPISRISENFSTIINSSINLNLLYNFSRFFSQTSIVLNPSSFAPFKTCNEQCDPKVAMLVKSNLSYLIGFLNLFPR